MVKVNKKGMLGGGVWVGRSNASFGKHVKYLKTAAEDLMCVCVSERDLLDKVRVGHRFLAFLGM